MDWSAAIRYDNRLRRDARRRVELSNKALVRIRESSRTKRIVYPEMKEAYDYVNDLYPDAGIKNVVALHASSATLNEVGYRGVGGFYDHRTRVIVISNSVAPTETDDFESSAEYTLDEVLCHELIHYGANYDKPLSNRNLEEEIAYGKSVGYLRSKGRTDDFIIHKNMMPYLLSVVDRWEVLHRVLLKEGVAADAFAAMDSERQEALVDKYRVKLRREMLAEAREIGMRMVSLYSPVKVEEVPNVSHQFMGKRNLILDDDE
jgi:hypothetical protein